MWIKKTARLKAFTNILLTFKPNKYNLTDMEQKQEQETENQDTALVVIDPKEFGLKEDEGVEIVKAFLPVVAEKEGLAEAYARIITSEITPDLCKQAREMRLMLVTIRGGNNKIHKAEKAYFRAGGLFVDAIRNKNNASIQLMEARCGEIENYYIIKEKNLVIELQEIRSKELAEFTNDLPADLGTMKQEVYTSFLTGAKMVRTAKEEAEKKAEQETIDAEKAKILHNERKEKLLPYWAFVPADNRDYDFSKLSEDEWEERFKYSVEQKEKHDLEQERIKKENEKLRREAVEKERLATIESNKRAEAEAERVEKEKKERAEREKAARELQEKQDAEAKKVEAERIRKEQIEQKKRDDIEAERIRKEKAEQEKREKIEAKRNAELRPYIVFIRDYNKILRLPEQEYKKELDDLETAAEDQWKHEREKEAKLVEIEVEQLAEHVKKEKERTDAELKRQQEQQEILDKERKEKQKLADELQAKKDEEAKKEKQKQEEIQTELSKGDAAKIKDLIQDLVDLKTKYVFKSAKNQAKYEGVVDLLVKVIAFIGE